MNKIEESELILNQDNSIFHLHLKPGDIADTIFLVGDPNRVAIISALFSSIEIKKENREFVTHTGIYNNKRLSVVSTGIGTDNIDIVLTELDALVNMDFDTRTEKEVKKSLHFIRIGTSGALQEYLDIDKPVISEYSIGIDGLLNFYENRNEIIEHKLETLFINETSWKSILPKPYAVKASEDLLNLFANDPIARGITVSSPGFYGPQGRIVRLPILDKEINNKLNSFTYNNLNITNYEMESSAIYGLSALMGHKALTICNIIANRMKKEFSRDYNSGLLETIKLVLEKIE